MSGGCHRDPKYRVRPRVPGKQGHAVVEDARNLFAEEEWRTTGTAERARRPEAEVRPTASGQRSEGGGQGEAGGLLA